LAAARSALPAILKQLCSLAESERRADLLESLESTKRRTADSSVRVAVVGLRRKGKSQLINALLNTEVCVVGEYQSTSVVTVVRGAQAPAAKLLVEQPGKPEPRPMPLPMEELQSDLAKSRYADGREVVCAEIGVPSTVLAGNLALIDTPGVGGRGQPHMVRVLNEVAMSDAAFFVTDASQEFTEPELRFLSGVLGVCPVVAIGLTKTDLYPDWRRIAAANQQHLQRAELHCPIIPLSSALRIHAVQLGDKALNAESGYPALLQFLRNEVLADAASNRILRIARDFDSVAQHLVVPLQAELGALRDPEFREKMTAELKEKKQLSDARAKAASSWQQVLSDGFADLGADIEFDLRTRLRKIGKEAEERLADGDPDKKWPQVAQWLQEEVSTAVADNFVWAYQSAQVLAQHAATKFDDASKGFDLPALDALCGGALIDPDITVGKLTDTKASRLQKVLVIVRGGYSGGSMVSSISSMLGMALAGPIAMGAPVVAGLLLGAQSYRDDRTNRHTRRRSEAQAAARKYIDEVSFQVGKLSRDRLKSLQRTLRDHFKSIAEQELASLQSSMKAAQESANLEFAEREKKAAQAEQKLTMLKKCRETAGRLQAMGANR
jgi:hypothetical protein